MTRAEVHDVEPDPMRAREFLEQARRFLQDAEVESLSLASSCILLYQSCVAAMDAILTKAGRTVGYGEFAHVTRINEALRLAGGAYSELFARIGDEWRVERGEVSYGAVAPSAAMVAAQHDDAREVVALAGRVLAT